MSSALAAMHKARLAGRPPGSRAVLATPDPSHSSGPSSPPRGRTRAAAVAGRPKLEPFAHALKTATGTGTSYFKDTTPPGRSKKQPDVAGEPATSAKPETMRPTTVIARPEPCWDLSDGWHQLPHHLGKEEVWQALRAEARVHADDEPVLASHLHSCIVVHKHLEDSLAFILANKLCSPTLLPTNLMRLISDVYTKEPDIIAMALADMQAVMDRDPACVGFLQATLFFKGFHAIQSHRIAHWLWTHDRKALALALQSRISEKFHVDVHPAAHIGRGVLLDHATGVVIGETAAIGDNVSMLHHVTIGGSGTRAGQRHPAVGHGVLLGAGVCVLGPIEVGSGTKVGAGSVIVTDLPRKCVAVGVPARIIKQDRTLEPCQDMDQAGDFVLDFNI